jgi:Cu+-exporting ATPase
MSKKEKLTCYHCGLEMTEAETVWFDGKPFCCNGCKTVYEILNKNSLSQYYTINETPGIKTDEIDDSIKQKYAYLDEPEIEQKLLEFSDGNTKIVNFYIPNIHCSSCIWVLENLDKLNENISHSEVNFPTKNVRITFKGDKISLRQVVEILASIAYPPLISLDDLDKDKKKSSKKLLYQLAIAGFAFGNIMLMALPEYFQQEGYWIERFAPLFRWIMLGLSVPVVFYSARDYFDSAIKGLLQKIVNVDILIALGITVLFLRSTYEVISGTGTGYFDSLTGLVFFLLLGKYFQRITYDYLSFERDYKSYFPIAVTKIESDKEAIIQIKDIRPGDRLLIRNEEIIPVDGILMKNKALIDYSFVTGESLPVEKQVGDQLLAGGKQIGGFIEIEAIADVDNSYLTKLWSREAFKNDKVVNIKTLTDKISQYFTFVILAIALIAGLYWYFSAGFSTAIWVITAVLIVACPCALALSAPFAFGNILRKFGYHQLYLKNAQVIEVLSKVNNIVFDKTGTLTSQEKYEVNFQGHLTKDEKTWIKTMTKSSNHPLSRLIYEQFTSSNDTFFDKIEEIPGKGIIAYQNNNEYKLGSAVFTGSTEQADTTQVYFSVNGQIKGKFVFKAKYREGISDLFKRLNKNYTLYILSGDNEREKTVLQKLLPENVIYRFNQTVHDKMDFIQDLQEKHQIVMMVGDGLNDAGALKQADVGIAVSENTNIFTPSSDGILKADKLTVLDKYLLISKQTKKIIYSSFFIAFIYNIIGLGFAVSNLLTPIVAAILMPISSISIVVYVTILTNIISNKLKLNK